LLGLPQLAKPPLVRAALLINGGFAVTVKVGELLIMRRSHLTVGACERAQL
jgi:hypothetical protein